MVIEAPPELTNERQQSDLTSERNNFVPLRSLHPGKHVILTLNGEVPRQGI